MHEKTKQKIHFGLIGIVNTALDFGLLLSLRAAGLPIPAANTLSTGAAFVFSFFANRRITFRAHTKGKLRQQILRYCLVTLFGLWVLQNGVILLITPLLDTHLSHQLSLLIAKLLATSVSLVWNYTLYARYVFRDTPTGR